MTCDEKTWNLVSLSTKLDVPWRSEVIKDLGLAPYSMLPTHPCCPWCSLQLHLSHPLVRLLLALAATLLSDYSLFFPLQHCLPSTPGHPLCPH